MIPPVNLSPVTISGSTFPSPFANTGLPVADLVLPGAVNFQNPNGGSLRVDTIVEEVHESELEMTENPVEAGSDITDHSFMRPLRVRLRCGWTNASLQAITSIVGGLLSGSSMALPGVYTAGGASATGATYVDSVYAQLRQIQSARTPISISTGLLQYSSMLIRSLRVTRDKETSQALMVEALCQQAIIVNTEQSIVPPLANQANPASTAALAKLGTQNIAAAAPSGAASLPAAQWAGMVAP